MFIKASVDRVQDRLVVFNVCLQHSHDVNTIIAAAYPENRRLDKTEQDVCSMLLDLGVSSRRIKSFLSHSSGKPLTLHDIQNQRVHLDKINANGQSDIQLLLSTVDDMLKNDL